MTKVLDSARVFSQGYVEANAAGWERERSIPREAFVQTAGAGLCGCIARHFAAAKMAHYLDGTTEVQNLVISRALFDGS